VCLGALLACASSGLGGEPRLETVEERFSYAVGVKLGRDLQRSDHAVDSALLERGLEDALAGRARLDEREVSEALETYGQQRRERLEALRAEQSQKAEAEARAFLARNRERAGVVELASGLQYEVLEKGTGAPPAADDLVTCHYRGALLDGSVFDDTYARGGPRTFMVASVVDGFEEALQRMPPGARWKLYLPPELAYGASGFGPVIPPYAVLIFEVELIAVGPPEPARKG
jgi:FKBP-type peptidyl-prolyl cis-trans isomerase